MTNISPLIYWIATFVDGEEPFWSTMELQLYCSCLSNVLAGIPITYDSEKSYNDDTSLVTFSQKGKNRINIKFSVRLRVQASLTGVTVGPTTLKRLKSVFQHLRTTHLLTCTHTLNTAFWSKDTTVWLTSVFGPQANSQHVASTTSIQPNSPNKPKRHPQLPHFS